MLAEIVVTVTAQGTVVVLEKLSGAARLGDGAGALAVMNVTNCTSVLRADVRLTHEPTLPSASQRSSPAALRYRSGLAENGATSIVHNK